MKSLLNLALVLSLTIACQAKESENPISESNEIPTIKNDSLFYKTREAKGTEKPVLLILMHGFGANEEDLLPLADSFPENYIVITPQAPYKIGDQNYQWYTSEKDADGGFGGKKEELTASITKIKNLVKSLQEKYNVKADKTFIGGFSQGANMSYELGLTSPSLFRGIAVLSGTIFNTLKETEDKTKAGSLKIFIAHGEQDNRIPLTEAESSKKWLDAHQYQSEFHIYKGMSHYISQEEIQDLVKFTQKNL
ncbi:dienelactone hydrolase family protein [Chryseobacterium sp. RG1]|uniref:Dienelactone hydrolase family protein n=1 Tax=Chryseobacterium tagetis TaxID=2801334 RepID=A0ABS8A1U8_9FLAO|nr:dienelactone hydrolase family protein [Chryseobacterium tagetis]MCA6067954.1 dienelactone hydrolase family protein [Chryseobacterium tagetis]